MSSNLRRNPPFKAEHLGSLLRPEYLLEARKAAEEHSANLGALKAAEDKAIKDIVHAQFDIGFNSISDGEYRRHMFWGTFFEGLDGFKIIERPNIEMFRTYMPDISAFMEEGHGPVESAVCVSKIKYNGSTYTEQWDYLKNLLPADKVVDAKLTLPAPEWYHMRYREGEAYPKSIYANDVEYFADITKAYQMELQILYDHGLRNVQIDDPNLAYFCSEKMLAGWKQDPLNVRSAEATLDMYIKLYNDCISRRPADMHVGVHLCRGNFVKSRHFSEGGYDRIAKKLFQDLDVNTYYLEYDTPRAGGFAPLKFLPSNKNVILGVITSKFPKMENLDELKSRVLEAADIVAQGSGDTRSGALNRIGVSPQCGFASHSGGNALGWQDMIDKLKLVKRLADAIWTDDRVQPIGG